MTFMCHTEFRHAVELLLLMSRHLSLSHVSFDIMRLMLCQDPFLSFQQSDARARAILLYGTFQLLLVVWQRQACVGDIASGIMKYLGVIAEEFLMLMQLVATPVDLAGVRASCELVSCSTALIGDCRGWLRLKVVA